MDRLDQQGVTDTFLHREWQDIRIADEEEQAFCAAAARLGQDPYGLNDAAVEALLASAEKMPAQLQDDFFTVTDSRDLADQTRLVENARGLAHCTSDRFTAIAKLRERTEKIDPKHAPWEQGYAVTRKLRDQVDLDATSLNRDSILAAALGVTSPGGFMPADSGAKKLFNAMVDSEQSRSAFCLALLEYLTAAETPSAFVTAARTDRQQRNRVFAAEFLAPTDWIRKRISGTWVGPDEVDE